jgi:uroporphyrin-III C-methyltransferase
VTERLTFVGAGPGDPDLLTRAGRDALRAADVVVSDRPSLDDLVDRHAPGADRVLVGRTASGPAWALDAIVDLLDREVAAGRRVVRLKSGDLFVCARTVEETEALTARGIAFALVPGVSAAVAAPAAAGIPVTRRDLTAAFTVVAGNDDPRYPGIGWEALAAAGGTIVVLMGRAHQRVIADHLLAAGLAPTTPVAVVHGGTRPDQQVRRGTLAELGGLRLPAPATVVIGAVAALDLTGIEAAAGHLVHEGAAIGGGGADAHP